MLSVAPLTLTLVGLSVDIIGALLVAVEAVKLSNLRALRDRLFVPVHRSLQPIPIVWHEDEPYVPRRQDRLGRWVLAPWWTWLLFHALLAALPIVLVDLLLQQIGLHIGRDAYRAYSHFFEHHALWVEVLLVLGTIYAGLLVIAFVGEPMHQLLIRLCALPITLLSFIDRKTPDGTVGIIGAAFLIAGFSFQAAGAIASNTHPCACAPRPGQSATVRAHE